MKDKSYKYLPTSMLVCVGLTGILFPLLLKSQLATVSQRSDQTSTAALLNLLAKNTKLVLIAGAVLILMACLHFVLQKYFRQHLKNKKLLISFRFFIVLSLMTFFTSLVYVGFDSPPFGIDDANIFFVYAKNFANHHGFVYNIGGETVEGFTSFLWVFMISLIYYFTSEPYSIILVLNILILSIALTTALTYVDNSFVFLFSGSNENNSFLTFGGILFLSWVFSSPGYASWTTLTYMETGIWSSFLILTSILVLNHIRLSTPTLKYSALFSLLILLLILTRPEGMLFSLLFLALFFLNTLLTVDSGKVVLKQMIPPVATYLVTILGITLFRLTYFGYPLPNTYYAKVSPDMLYNVKKGSEYFLEFFLSNGFILLHVLAAFCGLVIVGISLLGYRKYNGSLLSYLRDTFAVPKVTYFSISVITLLGVLIPIYEGGDHFGSFRFYQPIWPLLILPTLCLLKGVGKNIQVNYSNKSLIMFKYLSIMPLFIFFCIVNNVKWYDFEKTSNITHEFDIAENGREKGNYLNQLFADFDLPRVGVVTAGGIKFTYNGQVIDLLGINDIEIAHHDGDRKGVKNHASFNKEVFYRKEPDIVLPVIKELPPDAKYVKNIKIHPVHNENFFDTVLQGILEDEQFTQIYTAALVRRIDSKSEKYLFAYFQTKYLNQLVESGRYRVGIVH
jgi:hypothetical protein